MKPMKQKPAPKPAPKPANAPPPKPVAASRPPTLDDAALLRAVIDHHAQRAALQAEIARLSAHLVAQADASPAALAPTLDALRDLIARRHACALTLQQLTHDAGLAPPAPAPEAVAPAPEAPAPQPAPAPSLEPAPVRKPIAVRTTPKPATAAGADAVAVAAKADDPPAEAQPPSPSPSAPAPSAPAAPQVTISVSDERKRALEARLSALKLGPDSVERRRQALEHLVSLHEEVHDIDAPGLLTLEGQEREAGTLVYLCHAGLDAVALLPDVRSVWLRMVQARVRALQERALTKGVGDQVLGVVEALRGFVVAHAVGSVHGMLPRERPVQGTWALDAQFARRQLGIRLTADEAPPAPPPVNVDSALHRLQCCLEAPNTPDAAVQAVVENILAHASPQHVRLLNLLRGQTHRLTGEARRVVEQALKQRLAAEGEEKEGVSGREGASGGEEPSALPEGWPWWALTRDKRAVIIGGEVRQKQREMLERVFGFRQLKWHTTNVRRDHALAEQIKRRHVEFVIFTRFAQHQETYIIKPACQAAGVPSVRLSHGYGARELQLLIESNFAPAMGPDAGEGAGDAEAVTS